MYSYVFQKLHGHPSVFKHTKTKITIVTSVMRGQTEISILVL